MTFKEFLNESKDYINIYKNNEELFNKFLDSLQNYMEFNDKKSISNILMFANELDLIENINKVYRITCNESLGNFDLVSTSTTKLKGKTLDGVVLDMKDRWEYYNKKTCNLTLLEIKNPEGINVSKIANVFLKEKINIDNDYKDMFKRLKSEKEFLCINKNIDYTVI